MTPITTTRFCSDSFTFTADFTNLASQPLTVTADGQCKNREVMAAITDALSDQRCSDRCMAAIFKNAYLHHYLPELNQIIRDIEAQHGTGTVLISDNVKNLLAEDQINLTCCSDGTVQLEAITPVHTDLERQRLINVSLGGRLPDELCRLIGHYDADIRISADNKVEIFQILKYGDPAQKRALIAAASRQHAIPCFNTTFKELDAWEIYPINLTHIDLSDLDLTGIVLSNANLSFATLRNTCLVKAQLRDVRLVEACLNNANLAQADLSSSNLERARLTGANLTGTILRNARGPLACLLCAQLQGVVALDLINFHEATFNFCDFSFTNDEFQIDQFFPKADAPLNVVVLPDWRDPDPTFLSDDELPTGKPMVIDDSERRLLLTKGIEFHANSDGTIQLRRALTLFHDPRRDLAVDSTLKSKFPKALTELISAYDEEIEISERNETAILDILKSNDPVAKAQIIAAASIQLQIPCLNRFIQKLLNQRIRIDLSYVELNHLNLSGINLNYANLSHADMRGCDLSGASLERSILTHANLNDAVLTGAKFHNANMTDIQLTGANLSGAILYNVNLMRANLKFANLESAELRGDVDLSNAILDHANLNKTDLTRAKMVNASLIHASMHFTTLREANLTNAKLMHADISHANLMSVNLSSADLSAATLVYVNLRSDPMLTGSIWNEVTAKKISADLITRTRLPFRIAIRCV